MEIVNQIASSLSKKNVRYSIYAMLAVVVLAFGTRTHRGKEPSPEHIALREWALATEQAVIEGRPVPQSVSISIGGITRPREFLSARDAQAAKKIARLAQLAAEAINTSIRRIVTSSSDVTLDSSQVLNGSDDLLVISTESERFEVDMSPPKVKDSIPLQNLAVLFNMSADEQKQIAGSSHI